MNQILSDSDSDVLELEEVSTIDGIAFDTRVILFNDNTHTFEQVATQIQKAINCSFEKGMEIAEKVHNNGKAAVYNGDLAQCLKVSSVLQEIDLKTQIEC